MFAVAGLQGQTGPTSTPQQAPQTAPQVKATLPSYEGQNVASVELAGQPDVNVEELAPLLAQRAGEPFAQSKVDQSIAALQRTGHFQAVELEVRPEANGVRILLVLQPAIYFGVYEFPGALKHFSYSRLLQVADYPPRGAYTPVDIEKARQALEKFFKRNGYFLAEVRPEVQTDRAHGLANVIFGVVLNRKAKFGNVTLTGASPQETEHLQRALHSWLARLRSSAIRPGKTYWQKTLQNATQYLENELTKQEYLGGRVKLIGANYDPKTNRADIAFNVAPGPVVKVKVQGAHLWSWTRRKLLPVYQQIGLDPELIQEGRQNLTSYLQSKGFFDAQVAVQTGVEQQGNSESIVYQVTKGPRHKVAGIHITGNKHISEKDLLAHSEIEKAHFYSHGKYSEHLARDTAKNLRRIYQANGFSEAKVTPQASTTNGNLVVTFRVDEGQQEIVDSLRIEGNDNVPESQLAPKGLKVVPGQPYSTKRVDDDRNQIMAQLLDLGYLAATFHETARPVGGDKYKLAVIYQIYEGPEVHTASTVTVGRDHTRPALIDKTANIPVGRALREDQLLASESELYTLGVFDWAEVDPRRQITTQTQEDVVVKVHEAKRNEITYGGGFEVVNRGGSVPSGTVALPGLPPVGLPKKFRTSQQTIWGPRGNFQYTRKNLRGRAETISIGGLVSRLDQRGDITYSDPHFRESTNWSSNLSVTGERNSENPIFTSRLAEFGVQLQRPVNRDKTENVFVRYGLRETGLSHLLIPDLVPLQDRHVRLSTVAGSFIRDTRDNVLDAHKGIYETAELDLNPQQLGSSVSFAKFLGQGAYYKKIAGNVVWANSLRLGLEQPISGSHVPISEQFFSGGGSTLRGFPLNGAGPQRTIPACGNPSDPSTCSFIRVPTGGNQLFIVNSEFRIPVPADLPLVGKKLGVAVFYDGGNVYQRIGFHNFGANYTNTIGGGLRYATPVGPVRVDFGHNLNPVAGIKSFQIFVTLGQAF
jgi:outer membrane protein assembly factor BamA